MVDLGSQSNAVFDSDAAAKRNGDRFGLRPATITGCKQNHAGKMRLSPDGRVDFRCSYSSKAHSPLMH